MSEDNLSSAMFGEGAPKKTKWVPDQTGHSIQWHILKWHTKGKGESNAKSISGTQHGITSLDYDAWHKIHMQAHANGEFEDGHEHEHFTPKNK